MKILHNDNGSIFIINNKDINSLDIKVEII